MEMRLDDSQEMTRVLRILARAERLMQAGATLDEALVKMEISREEFGVLFDQYALPPNALEGLSSSSLFDAVVPVFHDDAAEEIEHIGSGIVLNVGGELFLLSAAHVFDSGETGNLYIPASESLEAMTGTIANTMLPPSGNRKDDRIDMAYFHLKSEWRDKLKDDVKPPPKVRKAIGIAWYRKDKYKRCLRIFHDASSLPKTFIEWQRIAKSTEAQVKASGMKAIRVDIDPETFPAWCKRNGFRRIDKEPCRPVSESSLARPPGVMATLR